MPIAHSLPNGQKEFPFGQKQWRKERSVSFGRNQIAPPAWQWRQHRFAAGGIRPDRLLPDGSGGL